MKNSTSGWQFEALKLELYFSTPKYFLNVFQNVSINEQVLLKNHYIIYILHVYYSFHTDDMSAMPPLPEYDLVPQPKTEDM